MADDISISGSSPAEKKKQEKLFMRAFFRKAGKAIYDYGLIAPGDKILVGVSGGKDSLALLEVLALRARDPKQDYTVVAAHIAVENVAYEVDAAYLGDFCARLGVRFVSRTIRSDVRDGLIWGIFVPVWVSVLSAVPSVRMCATVRANPLVSSVPGTAGKRFLKSPRKKVAANWRLPTTATMPWKAS